MKELCIMISVIWAAGAVGAIYAQNLTGLAFSLMATAIIWPGYIWFRIRTGYEK